MDQAYDYETEAGALKRKQQMIDLIMQQSLSPVQRQGGPGVAPTNPLEHVGKLLQQYVAQSRQKEQDTAQSALSTKYNEELSSGLSNFMKTRDGQSSMEESRVRQPNADGTLQQVPVNIPGDPKRAIMEALASKHPELRSMGKSLMMQKPERDPNALSAKDVLPYATPDSIINHLQGGAPLAPKAEKRDIHAVGNRLLEVPKVGGAIDVGGQGFENPMKIGGDLYQRDPATNAFKKLDNAPKTSVSVNAGSKAGEIEYYKDAARQVQDWGKQAAGATNTLNSLAELRNLDAKGIYSNIPSSGATFLSNLGQALGAPVDAARMANTETFNSVTANLWVDKVQSSGGARGWTEAETKELKGLLPMAAKSPEARAAIYAITENVAKRQIDSFRTANDAFAKSVKINDPEIFGKAVEKIYRPSEVNTQPALSPATSGNSPQNPMSYEEYIRKQQGGK